MHTLVATDGTLDPVRTADLVARLYEPGDTVTVFTAIGFPRAFLQSYAEISGVEELARIAHEAGAGPIGMSSGARAAEHMAGGKSLPVDPKPAGAGYFETIAGRRGNALVSKLREKGVTAELAWKPTENQTARTILAEIAEREVDTLVVGSHGQGGFEGPLGSTVTKIVRRSPIPVLVVR